MKIIESSADRLVGRDEGVSSYAFGILFAVVGIGVALIGLLAHQKNSLVALLFGLIFAMIGVGMVIFTKREMLVADKTAATINVTVKGLTGAKQASYAFDQIKGVQTLQSYQTVSSGNNMNNGMNGGSGIRIGGGNMGNTQTQIVTTTQLIMADGSQVIIEKSTKNAGAGALLGTSNVSGIGQQLAAFIGKPYEMVQPGMNPMESMGGAVAAVENIIRPQEAAPSVAPVAPAPQPGNPEAAGYAMPPVQPTVAPAEPVAVPADTSSE